MLWTQDEYIILTMSMRNRPLLSENQWRQDLVHRARAFSVITHEIRNQIILLTVKLCFCLLKICRLVINASSSSDLVQRSSSKGSQTLRTSRRHGQETRLTRARSCQVPITLSERKWGSLSGYIRQTKCSNQWFTHNPFFFASNYHSKF